MGKRDLAPSPLAQLVFDRLLQSSAEGVIKRPLAKLISGMSRLLQRLGDPLVCYDLNGIPLLLPLSHELPLYRKAFPDYSLNLGRIARQVAGKYSDIRVIDIGANIGDTAAILRSFARFPILCIEGNRKFLPLLQKNLTSLGGEVECAEAFVGSFTGVFRGPLHSAAGTAFLVADQNHGGQVLMQKLADILPHYPLYQEAKMIKIDTDGFDCGILVSEKDFLSRTRAVIFFEYDPFSAKRCGVECLPVFATLATIGYKKILVYDNYGDYHLMAELENKKLLEDIHQYYSGRQGKRYADVVAFPEEDSDLCEAIRASELAHFAAIRG
jgi:FkbM family methyltransferase